ncbi:MAG: ATP-binding cassette domain-containing protein [Prevotella sp.]|jgi:putative ABC transport system ATP-binding protein|nr:ATP-binding cassette domain-containing protein [Prevotella sp.]
MISLKNIEVTFNKNTQHEQKLFNNFNLKIKDGEFVIIIGDNGAGKSTLINLISGGVIQSKGKVIFNGRDVSMQNEYIRAKDIARVFQDPKIGTCSDMTVRENLSMAYNKASGHSLKKGVNKENDKYFKDILNELGLGLENFLDKQTDDLSGGQRQTLSLIMAMMTKPKILLLDEHIAALDPETAKIVLEKTEMIVKEHNLTAIMITHSIPASMKYGSRLIFMRDGVIMFDVSGKEKTEMTAEKIVSCFKKV